MPFQIGSLELVVPEERSHEGQDLLRGRFDGRGKLWGGDQPYLEGGTQCGGDLPKSVQLESVPPALVSVHCRGGRSVSPLRERDRLRGILGLVGLKEGVTAKMSKDPGSDRVLEALRPLQETATRKS